MRGQLFHDAQIDIRTGLEKDYRINFLNRIIPYIHIQIRMGYTRYVHVLLIAALTLLTSCIGEPSLEGKWMRVNDDFSYMQIEIVKRDNGYEARLLNIPDQAKRTGFQVGDLKWKEFKIIDKGVYSGLDLAKGGYNGPRYVEARLNVSDEDTIQLEIDVKGERGIGDYQTWIRLP